MSEFKLPKMISRYWAQGASAEDLAVWSDMELSFAARGFLAQAFDKNEVPARVIYDMANRIDQGEEGEVEDVARELEQAGYLIRNGGYWVLLSVPYGTLPIHIKGSNDKIIEATSAAVEAARDATD